MNPPKISDEAVSVESEVAKEIATSFFYWWYNQPGTNTIQGFNEWWEVQRSHHQAEEEK